MGDAHFELELRRRIAGRGDWPVARLDRVRAALARSEAQARFLDVVRDQLDEVESGLVRRGRNASVRTARVKRDVKSYRAATAFEVLMAHWLGGGDAGYARFESLLGGALDTAIDEALAASAPLERG